MISYFRAPPFAPLVLHCTALLLLFSFSMLASQSLLFHFFHTSASLRAPYAHTQTGSCSCTYSHSLSPSPILSCTHAHSQSWQFRKTANVVSASKYTALTERNHNLTQMECNCMVSYSDPTLAKSRSIKLHFPLCSSCTFSFWLFTVRLQESLCGVLMHRFPNTAMYFAHSAIAFVASTLNYLYLCVGLSRSCFLS